LQLIRHFLVATTRAELADTAFTFAVAGRSRLRYYQKVLLGVFLSL